MKNLIGGLFETLENANLAYEALRQSGFAGEELRLFVRKPREKTLRSTEIRVQDVAKNAILWALILGVIGALLGLLVGNGTFSLPYLEPGSAPRDPLFVTMSVIWGVITGGLTGAILGAATRLLRSREVAEVVTTQIEKRGVLLTVDVKDSQSESKVRRVLDQHKAVEVGNAHEKWDLSAWSNPN